LAHQFLGLLQDVPVHHLARLRGPLLLPRRGLTRWPREVLRGARTPNSTSPDDAPGSSRCASRSSTDSPAVPCSPSFADAPSEAFSLDSTVRVNEFETLL
jgi:hypothetical protein